MGKMKHDNSTIAWNNLGEEWFELAQTGESRMHFIMPKMLEYIGNVDGLKILDLGCGEGGYSRELAKRNAKVVAVDCSEKAIKYSMKLAKEEALDIKHYIRNSNDLYEINDNEFDIVLCSMMLMDCEDLEGTLREVVRVLKPNGNHEKGIGRQGFGIDRQVVVMNYFEPKQWEAPLYKGKTPVLWHHRTLEEYVKAFIKAGLSIVDINEPRATDEQAKISTGIAWLQKIPLYLYWELKKY